LRGIAKANWKSECRKEIGNFFGGNSVPAGKLHIFVDSDAFKHFFVDSDSFKHFFVDSDSFKNFWGFSFVVPDS
jgi:hypothetical protein